MTDWLVSRPWRLSSCFNFLRVPNWNTELEEASKSLREARRKFKHNSNYSNGEELKEKRDLFKDLLSESASTWIRNQLEQLGHKKRKEFWKYHKRIFKDKFENIGIVRNKNGEILCDPKSISQEFRKTFFEGRHLEGKDFHDWQPSVDYTIPELRHELDRDFSIVELSDALRKCRSSSFDNDMIHVTMLKKLGANMKNLLLFLFNTCWITSTWPWNISRITLIKKPGKKSYEQCSSYRPLSISSHVGKLFERMISARLRLYFETHNILDEEQEGFRTHRSTIRSLYRMHLVLEEAKRSKNPTALLNIDLEKAFDSIWVQGLLYKLESVNVPHRLLCIISSFLSNRKGFIDINGHYTDLFDIKVGLPQGSVLSPLPFIFYLSDFLSEVDVKFKFADDSSAIISSCNTNTLHSDLQAICSNIEFWCKKWRMVVNGSKTELLLLNCLADNIEPILLNGEQCKTKQTTKSLGLTIDINLTYRENTSIASTKASISWRLLTSKCTNRWGLSIPTQVFLYKTIIRPQLLYAEQIWAQRNYASLQIVQNRIIRSIMKHSMSPKITAIEVLMGIPPIDIYCSSIDIKFLIKAVNNDDLVTATHVKTLTRPSSLSSILLSKLRRFERTHPSHCYTRDAINAFIRDNWNRRWNSPHNDNFLKNFITNLPQETIHSPLLDGNPLLANMISDLLIGSSRRLAENLWKLSCTPSPLCICGTSEQNSYHYFFCCPNYRNFRPFHPNSLDLFISDDCAIISNFISCTNIL